MTLRSAILAASLLGSMAVVAAPADARPHYHGHGYHRPYHRDFHPHHRHFHSHGRHGYRR